MARSLAALLLLLVLPLFLRLAPISHGEGRNYVPDTHIVRSALGMAQDKDLAPPAGKYSNYPYLLPYLLLPVYAAEYALGKSSGEWSDPAGFAAAVATEPGRVHLPARVLVALFGAASAWVAFRAARAMGLNVAGVDLLRSADGPVVMEVNSSPGLEGIEGVSKVDVATQIIEFIENNARPWRTRTRGRG